MPRQKYCKSSIKNKKVIAADAVQFSKDGEWFIHDQRRRDADVYPVTGYARTQPLRDTQEIPESESNNC